MFWAQIRCGGKLVTLLSFIAISMTAGSEIQADTLGLLEAENIALYEHPAIKSVQSRQSALSEMEVAAGQLPDPMLKMGLMSLPTDSFNLGQEPMTQLQLGVVQKFPRGKSRSLRAEQFKEKATGMRQLESDVELRIQLAVREEFIEIQKQQILARINRGAEQAFTQLEEITQDYYATGRVQQQDVLRAVVELARVKDRSSRIAQEEDQARARMANWIETAAWREFEPGWPAIKSPSSTDSIKKTLINHPRLQALHQEVLAADKGVDLARQNYKPEFAFDLTYGGRGGTNPDGSARSDLLTFMVMMDVPLFPGKRQDRLTAAKLAESSMAAFNRDDIHRQMRSEVELYGGTLIRQNERLALFENTLLPEAEFNAEATFDAYQAALDDLTTLMRARITEFDLQLEYVRLQGETYKTQARLLYFEGAKS